MAAIEAARQREAVQQAARARRLEEERQYFAQYGRNRDPRDQHSGSEEGFGKYSLRGGAWNPLKAAYNEVANPDSLLRSRYVPAIANEIVGNQLGANLGSAVAASVTGAFVREGYTSSAASWLNAHGSEPVSTLRVMRVPVSKGINTLLRAMSLGQWDRAKKLAESDDVFHLVLIINGRFATEKLATITFTSDVRPPSNAEFMDVTLHGQMSINAMMQKTLDAMGKSKYFRYDAFSNNCQDFILAILNTNGLLTPELKHFIHQPAEVLAQNTPGFLHDAARAATNIGAMLGMGKGFRAHHMTLVHELKCCN